MEVIYQPRGKAREYAPLACNLADGCRHGCVYCYAARLAVAQGKFNSVQQFHREPRIRPKVLRELERAAQGYFNRRGLLGPDPGPVLLCFMTDAFQPLDGLEVTTEEACRILAAHNLSVKILTKAGSSAVHDAVKLLAGFDQDHWIGISLTTFNQDLADAWEPGAASVVERLAALQLASAYELNTWISLEPVIWPSETMEMVRQLAGYDGLVNHFAVGVMSRREELPAGLPQPEVAGEGGLALRQDLERELQDHGYHKIYDGSRPPAGEKTYYLKQGM